MSFIRRFDQQPESDPEEELSAPKWKHDAAALIAARRRKQIEFRKRVQDLVLDPDEIGQPEEEAIEPNEPIRQQSPSMENDLAKYAGWEGRPWREFAQ